MKQALLSIGLLFLCLSVVSAQKINLSFNPSSGKKYQYVQEMTQNITQTVMGQDIQTQQNISISFDMNILEKNNNSIKLSYTYKDVLFEVKSDQFNLRYKYGEPYDANPYTETLDQTFKSIIGKTLIVNQLPDGSVESVTGIEDIIASLKNQISNQDVAGQVIEQLKSSMLDENSLKQMIEQSTKVYPGKEIGIGESWSIEQTLDMPQMGSMSILSVYTLQSVENQKAHVKVKSVITMDSLNGEQSGTIEYDLKNGLPVNTVLNQDVAGEFSYSGFTFPISLTTDIKIQIK